eukprot:PhF_6_TR42984/c0_g1_i3/m.65519
MFDSTASLSFGNNVSEVPFLWEMCDAFEHQGEYGEAIRAAEGAFTLSKHSEEGSLRYVAKCTGLARHLAREQNQFNKAAEVLQKVQGQVHTPVAAAACAQSFLDISVVAKQRGDLETALMCARESARIQDSAQVAVVLGVIYSLRGNVSDSIQCCKKALSNKSLTPTQQAEALYHLSMSLEKTGNPSDLPLAQKYREKGLNIAMRQLGPQHAMTKTLLSAYQGAATQTATKVSRVTLPQQTPPSAVPSLPPINLKDVPSVPLTTQDKTPAMTSRTTEEVDDTTGPQSARDFRPVPRPPSDVPSGGEGFRSHRHTIAMRDSYMDGGASPGRSTTLRSFTTAKEAPLDASAQKHVARLQARRFQRELIRTAQDRKIALAVRVFGHESSNKKKRIQQQNEEHVQKVGQQMYLKMVATMKAEEHKIQRINQRRIWTIVKGYLVRRMIRRWKRAVIIIQQAYRHCRKRRMLLEQQKVVEHLKREKKANEERLRACLVLQKWFRSELKTLHLKRIRGAITMRRYHCARKIQRAYRGYKQKLDKAEAIRKAKCDEEERERHRLMEKHTVRIQTQWRGHSARIKYAQAVLDNNKRLANVTLIQSLWRGKSTRKWYFNYMTQLRLNVLCQPKNLNSFLFLERCCRGMVARSYVSNLYDIARKRDRAILAKIPILQAILRYRQSGFISRSQCQYLHKVKCTTTVQTSARRVLSCWFIKSTTLRKHIRAVRIITNSYIQFKPKLDELKLRTLTAQTLLQNKHTVDLIQRFMSSRESLTIVHRKEIFRSALSRVLLEIQRCSRGYEGRRLVYEVKAMEAALKRQHLWSMTSYATTIQTFCRYVRGIAQVRRQFLLNTTLAPRIQRLWRTRCAKQELKRLKLQKKEKLRQFSASRIQRNVRQFLHRRRLADMHEYYAPQHWKSTYDQLLAAFITVVQRCGRGYESRQSLWKDMIATANQNRAASLIQKNVRAMRSREELNKHMSQKKATLVYKGKKVSGTQAAYRALESSRLVAKLRTAQFHRHARNHIEETEAIARNHEGDIESLFIYYVSQAEQAHLLFLRMSRNATTIQQMCRSLVCQIRTQRRVTTTVTEEYELHKRVLGMLAAQREKELMEYKRQLELAAEEARRNYVPPPPPPPTKAEIEAATIKFHIQNKASRITGAWTMAYLSRKLTETKRQYVYRAEQLKALSARPDSPRANVLRLYWDIPAFVHQKFVSHRENELKALYRYRVVLVQKFGRGFFARRECKNIQFVKQQNAAEERRRSMKVFNAHDMNSAAARICALWRGTKLRRQQLKWVETARDVLAVQAKMNEENRLDRAAVVIQCAWRKFVARGIYKERLHQANVIRQLRKEVESTNILEGAFLNSKKKRGMKA